VTGAKEQNKYQSRTTGDMEKGKSIIVINMFFPLNLNFAIAQAAARPKYGVNRNRDCYGYEGKFYGL